MANVREFPLIALHYAAGSGDIGLPVRLVRLLHLERVYIFKLLMPMAS